MQTVSNKFAEAMGSCPYIARITLDGTDVIQGNVIQEIYFRGGCNSSENTILLGSAFSDSVEITLDQSGVHCPIEGRELFIELGIELDSSVEWIPMGKYTAGDPAANDGILTFKALDDLGAKLDVDYELLDGFDFSAVDGVDSNLFLAALCARRGVNVDISDRVPIQLKGSPDGFTERQIVGFIGALYGGFAKMDRLGVLRICTYSETDTKITADEFYSDGLEKATFSFTPGWLKCYNEAVDLTLFVGDFNAAQGINLQSIWMTQSILNNLWEQLQGFVYNPVSELSFFGNPLLDPGDIITLVDTAGELVTVPVMTIAHEYDGGLITSMTASGQTKTNDYVGPTRRAVFRSAEKVTETSKSYTDKENAKLNQLELLKRLTKEWVDDGIYLTEDGKIGINANCIKSGYIISVGQAYLPPTYDDVMNMLWSMSFPDEFPQKDFYDLNGDGKIDRDDIILARETYLGKRDISECTGAYKTDVTIIIDPSNAEKTVQIYGINMWGSEVTVYLGTNGSSIPLITGDCSVAGKFAVGDYAILQSLSTEVEQKPKALSWKDNGDGTYTLIGTTREGD